MILQSDFKDVPKDDETEILRESIYKLEGINVLHQFWVWDEFEGDSYIFKTKDVNDLNDKTLVDFLPKNKRKSFTISRGEGYTFVNFNFCDRDGITL